MTKSTIQEVFEECQNGRQNHNKLLNALKKICQQMDPDNFWNEFCSKLKYNMVVFKREPAVECTIEFVSAFATAKKHAEPDPEDDTDPFLLRLLEFLLQCHTASSEAVRFRCCQIINKVLNNMGEDAQLEDTICDKIFEAMLQRLRDMCPAVRTQAAYALARLQEPADPECPVTKAYLFLLSCDTSSDVRRAVLSSVAVSSLTLSGILERTRDVNAVVRRLAYQILADKVRMKALTIAQRVKLLQDGLTDRVEAVRIACSSKLLQSWLLSFGGNVIELLACLVVETSQDTAELTMKALFVNIPPNELVDKFGLLTNRQVIELDKLQCESVFYWKTLCQHIKGLGVGGEENLDKLLPTATAYADYIQEYMESIKTETDVEKKLQQNFVVEQLLELAGVLDLADEAGRKRLQKLIRDMLVSDNTSQALTKPLMALWKTLVPDTDQRLHLVAEIISEIQNPLTVTEEIVSTEQRRHNDLKIAGIRVKINQLKEELDECIKNQDFAKAAETKAKITELDSQKAEILIENEPKTHEVREERVDEATVLKCIMIAHELVQGINNKPSVPTLESMIETMIVPGMTNKDPAIRNEALLTLGLYCLLNKDIARIHLLLISQVAIFDQEAVRVSALKVIFDLIHTFGIEAFQDDNEVTDEAGKEDDNAEEETENSNDNRKIGNSLFTFLTGLLDDKNSEIYTVCAEGLAKLMLSGRVSSAKLFSRLILLWYNPITEDDTHLRHCLGTFFPLYAFAGRENQEIVEEALLPTMKTLFNAPGNSPLAEVDIGNVAELLVHLTNSRHLEHNKTIQAEEVCFHDGIAVKISNEILSEPNSFNVKTLCKILNQLELSTANEYNLKDLKILSERMCQEVKEKTCVKTLQKFHKTICTFLHCTTTDSTKGKKENAIPDVSMETSRLESFVEMTQGSDVFQKPTARGKVSTAAKRKKTLKSADMTNLTLSELPEETTLCEGDKTVLLDTTNQDLDNSVFVSPAPPSLLAVTKKGSKKA